MRILLALVVSFLVSGTIFFTFVLLLLVGAGVLTVLYLIRWLWTRC